MVIEVRAWKTLINKGLQGEKTLISMAVFRDGQPYITSGPVWVLPLLVAEVIFGKEVINLIPVNANSVEVDLTMLLKEEEDGG